MGREHHGTNCAYRANPDEPCTCGVTERTEREMHAAWRKRAEEAETALAAMTADRDGEMWLKKLAWAERDIARARHAEVCKERDAQAEAVSLLAGECSEWRLAHVCSPVSLIDAPIIRARKRTMNNPIARAAVEGER